MSKRKPAKRGPTKTPSSRRKAPAPRRQPARLPPELPLQQGLVEMATIGAHSFFWVATVVAGLVLLVGAFAIVWSQRPIPIYSSDQVTVGSPFAVTFRVDNTNAWFPLAHLNIRCVVEGIEATDVPPVDVAPAGIPARIEPGQQASFTCPFRPADREAALRSELYFRSEYDLPGPLAFRLVATIGPFILNTRLLPPRWTPKPGRD